MAEQKNKEATDVRRSRRSIRIDRNVHVVKGNVMHVDGDLQKGRKYV